jgi:hypothetical protein
LVTNELQILTHILILRLISSKLHTIKSNIHYESLIQYRLKQILALKAMCYDSMNVQQDILSQQAEE